MVDIAAGGAHSACITASGELFTWGKGRYGRLGHGDSEDQLKPKLVSDHLAQFLTRLAEKRLEKITRRVRTGIKQFTLPHSDRVFQTVTV